MTLIEKLETMPDDALVRVGAKGGTNFIFAGSVADVKNEEPVESDRVLRELNSALAMWESKIETVKKAKLFTKRASKQIAEFIPFRDREIIDEFYASRIIDDVDKPVMVLYVDGPGFGRWHKIGKDGKGDVMK